MNFERQSISNILLISFIFIIQNIPIIDNFKVCSSINIQGTANLNRFQKVKNCNIVVGYVRILNAKFEIESNNNSSLRNASNDLVFHNLVEITDYLLIFQAQNLDNLARLFPKLSIIRGDKLFKNYALIIFLTNSLLQVNLNSLVSIEKGSILLSRLYHACYINTIDWNYLIKQRVHLKPTIGLINNECYTQSCKSACKSHQITTNNNENQNCWSEKDCQLKCSTECKFGCNMSNTTQCCTNDLCSNCYNDSSCVSCSNYRDVKSGSCVKNCSLDTLIYEQHSCVRIEDCSLDSNSLIKQYHILNETYCVRECPNGYESKLVEIKSNNSSKSAFNVSKCIRCIGNVCKRECLYSFNLKQQSDLNQIKNCFRVKSLQIEFRSNITQQSLLESLQYLEIIEDFLIIVRNKHLNSLNFLQNLRLINGRNLYEKKFALFVHTNEILRELWNYEKTEFRILNGSVEFFENPKFCYQDIEHFLAACKLNFTDSEISFNFNGYRRLTCSNQKIELKFEYMPSSIVVSWNVIISDLRRLKGFILSYTEVPDGYFIDQNDIDFMYSYKSTSAVDSLYEWNYLYVHYDESIDLSRSVRIGIDVEPFTRYAIYVKADLTIDSHLSNMGHYSSFALDRVISEINYVYSLTAQPSRVQTITYEPISFGRMNLKWYPPTRPNGIIEFYFIAYAKLTDLEHFPDETDACQFTPNSPSTTRLTASNYELKIKTAPVSDFQNETDNTLSRKKELCILNMNTYQAKKKKLNDDEKNDIISVEDEIYNLAFRPAKPRATTKSSYEALQKTVQLTGVTETSTLNSIQSNQTTTVGEIVQNMSLIQFTLQPDDYNITSHLIRLIRQDLFVQDEELFQSIKTSNLTYNATISNLTSFGRYIVSLTACQNFTQDLKKYASSYGSSHKNRLLFVDYLKFFPIENYCSKSSLITFRSLADAHLDQVNESSLFFESQIWYFKWSKPLNPNGFIYKYNLRFIDLTLNKTQGPLCYAGLDNLKVALNSFLLTEGHEYLIQVQAVSNAGPGPWSSSNVRYKVPNISNYYIKLIIGIFGCFLLIITMAATIYSIIRKYNISKERGYFSINSHYYYFRPDEWEIKRENITIGERIGAGCFAEVHRGTVKLKNNQIVDCAIKFCGSDNQNRQRILKEANMMKSINTTHIVKLLGVVSKDNPAYLILEFMDKGDLKEFLKNFRNQNRELKQREEISLLRLYRIAAEIADGMLWLSEHKYIHRDLAARNCLISKNDVIKIADLGLSKDIYQDPVYREKCKSLLPIRWMSPESLIDGSSTTKSDVWSYGVVLFEISTYGDNPYNGKENEEVIEFVKTGGRLEMPANAPVKFLMLLNKCLVTEDYKRISFKEIIEILDPDLTCDFKQTSYYHNEYKNKLAKKKQQLQLFSSAEKEKTLDEIKKADLKFCDFDNYM